MTREERRELNRLSALRYRQKEELLKIAKKSKVIDYRMVSYTSGMIVFYCDKHTRAVDNLINKAKEFCYNVEERGNDTLYLKNYSDDEEYSSRTSLDLTIFLMYNK